MNRLSLLSAAAFAALLTAFAPAASAAGLDSSVSVKVIMSSKCQVKGTPTLVVDFGTYQAFSASAVSATGSTVTFQCTRGFGTGPTVAWDAGGGTTTGTGTVAGLQYSLTATPGARVPGSDASTTSIGTADEVPVVLTGSMPALQAGTESGATAVTATRTLTVTF